MVCLALLPWAIVSGRCRSTGEEHSRVCDHRSNRSEWSPSSHAQIKLSPVPKAAAKKLETGADGRSSVALRLGSYDLFIARPGFRRRPMHIYLQDAASQTANVVFVGRVLVQKLSIALAMSRPYRPLTDRCD